MNTSLAVIILTFNEAQHLQRCIDSVKNITSSIFVIDSYSTDDTVAIAQSLGAVVYQNKFINHAAQLNWALDNCPTESEWILRLDADEIVTPELAQNIKTQLANIPADVVGLTINRQIHFLGKWIKRGGIYPIAPLRLWRTGKGRCENRWMDEHIIVEGKVQHLDGDIADINLNNLTWWTTKHNHYASREAIDLLMIKYGGSADTSHATTGQQAKYKRWLKENVYSRLPLGVRAFSYFILRYIFMLGFLDGWQGLAFHSLQGLWYRFLVDLKVYELEQLMQQRKQTLAEVVRNEFGYDIDNKQP